MLYAIVRYIPEPKKKNDRQEILAKVVEAKRRFNKNEHEWFVRPNSMAAINSNKWG